jgi:predicted short-subunit dehydrogenase-like oxidoreductase (DUF2520 family)
MRQVPTQNKILIIGNGKTAKHLSFYFNHLGYQITAWHYKHNNATELTKLFATCDYCFILIKDDALTSFVQQNSFLKSKKSFHCSGSVTIDGVTCLHPLMTFSQNLYDIAFYKKIHWAIFEEHKQISDYLPLLTNPHFYVKPEQKTLYHAMCVMSGNFTQLLLQQVLTQWQDTLHLTQTSLQPYMQVVMENFWQTGSKALTGPLARKDFGTIRTHLLSLKNTPLLELYQSFLKLYLNEQELTICYENINLEALSAPHRTKSV